MKQENLEKLLSSPNEWKSLLEESIEDNLYLNKVYHSILEKKFIDGENSDYAIWQNQLRLDQLGLLFNLIQMESPSLTIETGFGAGSSALAFLASNHNLRKYSTHISIDPYGMSQANYHIVLSYIFKHFYNRFLFYRERSEIVLPQLCKEKVLQSPIIAYIDGSHLFENKLIDFFYLDKLAPPHSIIIFDDALFPSIETVINFVKANKENYVLYEDVIKSWAILYKTSEEKRQWNDFHPFIVPERSNWTPKFEPIYDKQESVKKVIYNLVSKQERTSHNLLDVVHNVMNITKEKFKTNQFSYEEVVNYVLELLNEKFQLSSEEQYRAILLFIKHYANEKFTFVLAAKLAYEQNKNDEAFSYIQKALNINLYDLYTQRLFNEIKLSLNLSSWSKNDEEDLSKRFCTWPFERVETRVNNDVFFCCSAWLNLPIGNMSNDSLEQIWNSEAAQKIRMSIIDGSFKYCSRKNCPRIVQKILPFRKNINSSFVHDQTVVMPYKFRDVKLAHDYSCNLACPSCRTSTQIAKGKRIKVLSKIADTIILPMLKGTRVVGISGQGDPFASKHYRYIMKKINAQEFPDLKIDLSTNGVLFDEESWNQLELKGLCRNAMISIDSTIEESYNMLRKGGDFKRLMKNFEFISKLKKQGELNKVILIFIVQKENFLQIPDFIKLTKQFDFDTASLSMILPWGHLSREEYEEKNIGFSEHPLHQDFLEVLRDPLLQDEVVSLGTLKPFYDEALKALSNKGVPSNDFVVPERSNLIPQPICDKQESVNDDLEKSNTKQKSISRLEKLRQSENNQYTLKSFDKHKCIFVHIPKTAGVSVVKSLFDNLGGGHAKIGEYQQLYTETEFKNYFKFTFVRNPWDRLVSAYNFLITGGINERDKNWAENNLRQYPDFDSFVKNWLSRKNVYTYPHFIPQFEFVCIEGLEPAVDFIGYFENLEEDFEYVANKLGIQTKLQHLNKTERKTKYYGDKIVEIFVDEKKDYTEYYTDETAKIVADVYREDIEIFGYDFG